MMQHQDLADKADKLAKLQAKHQLDWAIWFSEIDITGDVADKYTAILLQNGCGSVERLKGMLITDDRYLNGIIGFHPYHIGVIKKCLLTNASGGGNQLGSSSSSSSSSNTVAVAGGGAAAGTAVVVAAGGAGGSGGVTTAVSPDAIVEENGNSNNRNEPKGNPADQHDEVQVRRPRKQPCSGVNGFPSASTPPSTASNSSSSSSSSANGSSSSSSGSSSGNANGSSSSSSGANGSSSSSSGASGSNSSSSSSRSSSANGSSSSGNSSGSPTLEEIKQEAKEQAEKARKTAEYATKESKTALKKVASTCLEKIDYQGGIYRGEMVNEKPHGYGVYENKGMDSEMIQYAGRFEYGVFKLGTKVQGANSETLEEHYSGGFDGDDSWESWEYSGLGVAKVILDDARNIECYAGSHPSDPPFDPPRSLTF